MVVSGINLSMLSAAALSANGMSNLQCFWTEYSDSSVGYRMESMEKTIYLTGLIPDNVEF